MVIKIKSDYPSQTCVIDLEHVRTFTYYKDEIFRDEERKKVKTNVIMFYWKNTNVYDDYQIDNDRRAKIIINKVEKYLLNKNKEE